MGLFSGLEKMGLGKLNKLEVFEEDTAKKGAKKGEESQQASKPKVTEEDLLFDKSYTCPVCNNEFHSKMIRTGKVKLLSADTDLRPKYQLVDSLKYDALVCPSCGYAALSRFFKFMMPAQERILQKILVGFRRQEAHIHMMMRFYVISLHLQMLLLKKQKTVRKHIHV